MNNMSNMNNMNNMNMNNPMGNMMGMNMNNMTMNNPMNQNRFNQAMNQNMNNMNQNHQNVNQNQNQTNQNGPSAQPNIPPQLMQGGKKHGAPFRTINSEKNIPTINTMKNPNVIASILQGSKNYQKFQGTTNLPNVANLNVQPQNQSPPQPQNSKMYQRTEQEWYNQNEINPSQKKVQSKPIPEANNQTIIVNIKVSERHSEIIEVREGDEKLFLEKFSSLGLSEKMLELISLKIQKTVELSKKIIEDKLDKVSFRRLSEVKHFLQSSKEPSEEQFSKSFCVDSSDQEFYNEIKPSLSEVNSFEMLNVSQ